MLRIEEIMKERGVGVTELATMLNVSRQTVYYYIKQDDKNSISQLQKIAEALKVSVSDILGSKEKEENTVKCPNCGILLEVNQKSKV